MTPTHNRNVSTIVDAAFLDSTPIWFYEATFHGFQTGYAFVQSRQDTREYPRSSRDQHAPIYTYCMQRVSGEADGVHERTFNSISNTTRAMGIPSDVKKSGDVGSEVDTYKRKQLLRARRGDGGTIPS